MKYLLAGALALALTAPAVADPVDPQAVAVCFGRCGPTAANPDGVNPFVAWPSAPLTDAQIRDGAQHTGVPESQGTVSQ